VDGDRRPRRAAATRIAQRRDAAGADHGHLVPWSGSVADFACMTSLIAHAAAGDLPGTITTWTPHGSARRRREGPDRLGDLARFDLLVAEPDAIAARVAPAGELRAALEGAVHGRSAHRRAWS